MNYGVPHVRAEAMKKIRRVTRMFVTICCSGSISRSGRKLGSCETELIVAGVVHAVEALQEGETI
jgi:hypothetical protein